MCRADVRESLGRVWERAVQPKTTGRTRPAAERSTLLRVDGAAGKSLLKSHICGHRAHKRGRRVSMHGRDGYQGRGWRAVDLTKSSLLRPPAGCRRLPKAAVATWRQHAAIRCVRAAAASVPPAAGKSGWLHRAATLASRQHTAARWRHDGGSAATPSRSHDSR